MASSLALRRGATTAIFNRLVNPIRSVSAAARSFTADAEGTRCGGDGSVDVQHRPGSSSIARRADDDERSLDVDHRGGGTGRAVSRRRDPFTSLFSDVLDPFSPTRSLSQILNLMDQFLDDPFVAASRGMGAGSRRGFNVKEDDNALYMRIEMPGLDKEDVKVVVEGNTLVIIGEGKKESEDDDVAPRYSSRIDLPPNLYKIDQIKAEMRNGVLKIVVPKVKEEERKKFEVNVE
ncbi:small heat shock protein, chloroplastic-like isoform X2 [Rhododendron vialii]|uniref:small heat shock protein, chloroplastic-like isoform X2 n=1 Tax=Rhododendron vialii TaxID=182163 RepID=UPI00265DEF91|nr:small heat shock protein, chloroplastic-like isoform X2 [Rhododendron vialii]